MASSFENSLSKFREFLQANNYPPEVAWVEPQDVLISGRRLIYVLVPVRKSNEQRARQLFDLSQTSQRGIVFGTVCSIGNTTYAYAWMPADAAEAERSMTGDGLKMSVKVDAARVPGQSVSSKLLWTYLRLRLRERQHLKQELFR